MAYAEFSHPNSTAEKPSRLNEYPLERVNAVIHVVGAAHRQADENEDNPAIQA